MALNEKVKFVMGDEETFRSSIQINWHESRIC